MAGGSFSPGGVRDDFLQKIGGALNDLPTLEHHRQCLLGGQYDLLPCLSFVFCERDLGCDSNFVHHKQKTTLVALAYRSVCAR